MKTFTLKTKATKLLQVRTACRALRHTNDGVQEGTVRQAVPARTPTYFYVALMLSLTCIVSALLPSIACAQSVILPAPRLLTTWPMGGQRGTEVEVTITGQTIEETEALLFSHPGITAKPIVDATGNPTPNKFIVSITDDCPLGIHEARVFARLGVSSARAFTVSALSEAQHDKPSTSVETAIPLEVNSICNATVPVRAVNHYKFVATKGQRIVVDCAAKGIDSKMNPVLVVADAEGRDLKVERRGGALDFTVPADGDYIVKVHELTFKGGAQYFYRLAITELAKGEQVKRLPSTRSVSSFSWPPTGLADIAASSETEPNSSHAKAQKITLPCDISGNFFPAADVDTFEFTAKKGEVWWIEVASERLGRPTDPSLIVQHVDGETITDVAELTDIASPIKPSSNAYSYDGPPYNAGSSDILGKVEIKHDGLHRIQLTDLFGGTRSDARNIYRMIVRKAQPDFAVVAWALHMNLRNGDRNALSKPIALRGGQTMALEVIAVRRDGFNGDIDLTMEDLPDGVTATGLKIPAGKSRGIMLVSAHQDAPRGMKMAKFSGQAEIDGKTVVRACHTASMAWPVPNAWSEIPAPRLVGNLPVSVGGSEFAGISIAAKGKNVWEVKAGETLTIPLVQTKRGEFSGANMSLRTFGAGFEGNSGFDIPLKGTQSKAVLDMAKLKTPPGEYNIAFYGKAVAKYSFNPDAVPNAEEALKQAEAKAAELTEEEKRLATEAKTASKDQQAAAQSEVKVIAAQKKAAAAAVAEAKKVVATAKRLAQPKDIVDIYVSEPITIRVTPAEKK